MKSYRIKPATLLTGLALLSVFALVFIEQMITIVIPEQDIIEVSESQDENIELEEFAEPYIDPLRQSNQTGSKHTSAIQVIPAEATPTSATAKHPIDVKSPAENNKNTPTRMSKEESSLKFQQALKYSRKREYNSAKSLYRQIVTANPNHQMAMINLGLLLKKEGACDKALVVLKDALKISGTSRKGKIYSLLGACFLDLGNTSEAIKKFKLSIDYRPSHALTWRRYAEALHAAKQPSNLVISTYDKSIALSPSNPLSKLSKAKYQMSILDYEGAIKTLKHQIKSSQSLDNISLELHKNLLWSYIETDKIQSAAKALDWLKNFPLYSSKLDFKSLQSLIHGDSEKAINLLKNKKNKTSNDYYVLTKLSCMSSSTQQCLTFLNNQTTPLTNRALYLKAITLYNEKNWQDSLNVFIQLKNNRVHPHAIYPFLIKANAYLEQEDVASEHLAKSIEQYPNQPAYRHLQAWLAIHFNKPGIGLEYLDELAKKYPNDLSLLRLKAHAHAKLGEIAKATTAYKNIKKNYSNLEALYEYSIFLYGNGSYEDSKNELLSILDENDYHKEGRFLLAKTYCRLGQYHRCQSELERLLSLDSAFPGAQELRSSINKLLAQLDISIKDKH